LYAQVTIACGGIVGSWTTGQDEQQRQNSTADCERRGTCAECTESAPACRWSLATQRCDNATAAAATIITNVTTTGAPPTTAATDRERQRSRANGTADDRLSLKIYDPKSCPKFSVDYYRRTIGTTEHHTVTVNVANDPTRQFKVLLDRSTVTCRLNRFEFRSVVLDDGRRIVCETSEKKTNSSRAPMMYFSVGVNGVPLVFDDKKDHYVNARYNNGCHGKWENVDDAECANCVWDDAEYRYYCQWCPSNQMCAGPYQQCDIRQLRDVSYPMTDVKNVLVRCPAVRILSFEPKYGPWAGGTTVRVNVSNHHRVLWENKLPVVTVAGSRCLLPTLSRDGAAFTCTITTTNARVLNEGPVEVMYASKDERLSSLTIRSDEQFYFVDPEISDIRPACGPVSGGTRLTIRGNYLDAGNALKVSVRDNITCAVVERTGNYVKCVTGPSEAPIAGSVKLEFDNRLSKYATDPSFEYAGEPTVDGDQTFVGIASGGTRIPVRGQYFSCVENPLIHVMYNGVPYAGNCRVRNDTYMTCTAPKIGRSAALESMVTLQFGFNANHDQNVLPLHAPSEYRLYPDPAFTDFETTDTDRTTTVTINGARLNEGYCPFVDLSVRLLDTGAACNVTAANSDRVMCRTTTGESVNGIVATVGNVQYEIKRKMAYRAGPTALTWLLIGTTVVSLVITCVVAVAYCLKIAVTASGQQNEMQSLCERHRHDSSTTVGDGKDDD